MSIDQFHRRLTPEQRALLGEQLAYEQLWERRSHHPNPEAAEVARRIGERDLMAMQVSTMIALESVSPYAIARLEEALHLYHCRKNPNAYAFYLSRPQIDDWFWRATGRTPPWEDTPQQQPTAEPPDVLKRKRDSHDAAADGDDG